MRGAAYISCASIRHLPICGVFVSGRAATSPTQPADASPLSISPSMSFVLIDTTVDSRRSTERS